MNWMNKKLQAMREEDGFTLIELMVVVLIIAILIAIAIPTFLGARTRAQDRAAQSSLREAVTAAKVLYTDNEDYATATPAALNGSEPSLTFQAAASTDGLVVSVTSAAGTPSKKFSAAVLSKSGTCWYVRDNVDPTATTNPGTRWARDDTPGAGCTGAIMNGVADSSFDLGVGKTPSTAFAL